jgi:hypothetical protein
MSFTQADVLAAFDHFSRNWGEITSSSNCVCSFCLKTFEVGGVAKVYREENGICFEHPVSEAQPSFTAVCPHCRLPYCLGDASGLPAGNPDYVAAVQQHWHR